MENGEKVHRHRTFKSVSQALLGPVVDRSQNWISKVERGVIPISEEVTERIIAAIDKIAELKDGQRQKLPKALEGFGLPTRVQQIAHQSRP